jgi:type IV pilus assembly protein PilP
MMRWSVYLICGLIFCFAVVGCSEDTATSTQPQRKTAVKKPPAQQVPPPEAKKVEKKEPEFEYVSEGRRDPFVPLSRIKRPLVVSQEPATPLQSYDLSQFRLIGVIVGKGDSKAMVVAPDGKSYVLYKGVKIGKNSGVVTEITSDTILIEEKYYDFSGNIIENTQEITVPKRKGA